MCSVRWVVVLVAAVLCSAEGFIIKASYKRRYEDADNTVKEDNLPVSTLIERANVNVGKNLDESVVILGDIALDTDLKNADPCTRRNCLWPKASDGNVYVPYRISNVYSTRERNTIIQGLQSFASSTCIRFFPLNGQQDFVDIRSLSGCFSYIGRRGRGQPVSLMRRGCVFKSVIQHELLHALGFNHEQTRSDRDENVRILLNNVIQGQESNFRKINTINLGTPYDYNSVMHYDRFAFSKNGRPTIVPVPDNNVSIGRATEMSRVDILRVNRLYRCNTTTAVDPYEEVTF